MSTQESIAVNGKGLMADSQTTGTTTTTRLPTLLVLAVLALFSGCEAPLPPIPHNVDDESASRCDNLLDSTLDMLDPGRLGITSDRERVVSQLNAWVQDCAQTTSGDVPSESRIRKMLEPVLSLGRLNHLTAERFSPRDTDHIRNCLFYQQISRPILKLAENDLDRAVGLFDFVVRNIEFVDDQSASLPLTLFEVLLFGRGTAEDCAWLFANLLRQAHIDAVILRPRTDTAINHPGETERRWLVGVLIDDGVYLFDPRLGSPIPSAADQVDKLTVRVPATLAEVLKNDGLLRQLDASEDRPYPLRADDLKSLSVELIGNSSFWSRSLAILQPPLSEKHSVMIYDSLADGSDGLGLVSRVAGFGHGRWDETNLAVWPYPEQRLEGFETMNVRQKSEFEAFLLPFGAPRIVQINGATGQYELDPNTPNTLLFGPPLHKQQETRILQLTGDYESGILNYQKMRLVFERMKQDRLIGPTAPVQVATQFLHEKAAIDAFFWLGFCQLDRGDPAAAADTFRNFLSQFEQHKTVVWVRNSVWHCRMLMALSLAEQGQLTEAIQTLDQAAPDDPHRERYQLWRHRLLRAKNRGSKVEGQE